MRRSLRALALSLRQIWLVFHGKNGAVEIWFSRREMLRSGTAALLAALGSCHMETRDVRSDEERAQHQARDLEMEDRLRRAEIEIDKLKKEQVRLSSRVECTNDAVREFLKTCEQENGGCSGVDVANNFKPFLDSQHYVRVYLRPDTGIDSLIQVRHQLLEDQGAPSERHPSTRFIVLTLPRSNSQAHLQEAERIGHQIVRYLRQKIGIPFEHRILGPKTLPCNYKREELLKTRRRIDQRQSGEPTEGTPTIHAWIFRTECG